MENLGFHSRNSHGRPQSHRDVWQGGGPRKGATRRPLPLRGEWLSEILIVGGESRVQALGFALDVERGELLPQAAQVIQRMSSMARAPDMTQRIAERSMRSLTTHRQAPSMTPEEMGNPCSRSTS